MASLITGIVLFALAAPAPEAAICDWMSGSSHAQYHPYFANVAAAQARGDFERAVAGFVARSKQISKEAEINCFVAGGATLEETEKFFDSYVRCERPLLFARRDQWALGAETVAWGAWLACRDGQTGVATRLLRSGWRDWAATGLLVDAALLMLANGKVESSADFLDENDTSVAGMVAQAIFHCRTSQQEAGLKWFTRAAAAAVDEASRARVEKLREGCIK